MVAAETLPPLKTKSVLRAASVYAPIAVDAVTDVVLLYSKSTALPEDTSERELLV